MRWHKAWTVFLMFLVLALSGCADDDTGDDGDDGTGDGGDGTDGGDDGGDGGDGSDDPTETQNVSLEITADGAAPATYTYDKEEMSVPANATVTLTLHNEDTNPAIPHDWVLENVDGAATERIGAGESTEVTFTAPAEPGEYTYYCSVQGHRDGGMEGTLTVTAS